MFDHWKYKKNKQNKELEKDVNKYIKVSFRKDFQMNGRDIEIFEPPKILGDVFEALIGAVYIDGGIEKVVEVYQHILAPFVVFVAKYSKKLNKEAKEDFFLTANANKIKPVYKAHDSRIIQLSTINCGHLINSTNHSSFQGMGEGS